MTHLYAVYKKFSSNRKMQTESEGMEKIFHFNRNKKKAGVTILI